VREKEKREWKFWSHFFYCSEFVAAVPGTLAAGNVGPIHDGIVGAKREALLHVIILPHEGTICGNAFVQI
jgi:hypothetical protein